MITRDVAYWLARIRRELEAAGLPVERMTVVVDQPRPPRRVVRQPPPSHPMPLFEPAAGLSIRQGRAPPHAGEGRRVFHSHNVNHPLS